MPLEGTYRALNDETREQWDTNAEFWDARMGEGNPFQRLLVGPATERLLEPRPGLRVLELACGNGVMARRLAELGARVLATDFSVGQIERARARTQGHAAAEQIEFRVLDATNADALLALGARAFDAAVCNMAFHDLTDLDPLLGTLPQLLALGGRFVFSLMHPCFNSPYARMCAEEEDRNGQIVEVRAVKLAGYATPVAYRSLGMIGQPVPHHTFHRPLSLVLAACFRHGWVLDGLEEPTFGPEERNARWFGWANFAGIPPVLAARLRQSTVRDTEVP